MSLSPTGDPDPGSGAVQIRGCCRALLDQLGGVLFPFLAGTSHLCVPCLSVSLHREAVLVEKSWSVSDSFALLLV